MPEAGSNFMDWQQEERESRLLMDEDFSWSDPPRSARRRITGGRPAGSSTGAGRDRATGADRALRSRADRHLALVDREPAPFAAHDREPDPYLAREVQVRRAPAAPPVVAGPWADSLPANVPVNELVDPWDSPVALDGDASLVERAFDLSDPGGQGAGQGTRRTVVITGHGDDRYLPAPRAPRARRSSPMRFHERSGFSPDRAGLWAVLLSVALVIGAIVH
jgi:hypothetical protein